MNEKPTNQIPSAMFKAAAKAVLPLCGWTKTVIQGGDTQSSQIAAAIEEYYDTEWLTFGEQVAQAVFEAAGVPNLLDQIETYQQYNLRNQEEWHAPLMAKDQRIAELEAELSKHQESRFHPDWSLLMATRESLREAQARIGELQSQLAERDEAYRKVIAGECAPDEVHCPCVPHLMRRIGEVEACLADAFDWIGHLPKSANSASTVSVNDWIHQAGALLEKAPAGAGGGE